MNPSNKYCRMIFQQDPYQLFIRRKSASLPSILLQLKQTLETYVQKTLETYIQNIATGETSPVISSLTIMTFITR